MGSSAMAHGPSAEMKNTNNPGVGDKKLVIEGIQILHPGFRKRKRKATRILYPSIETREEKRGGRHGINAGGNSADFVSRFFPRSANEAGAGGVDRLPT